ATICAYLDFASVPKTFYLFDTFAGIPVVEGMTDAERTYARDKNATMYFDCFAATTKNFAAWPNVKLVRGVLPGSLADVPLEKIAWLHIDLNNAVAEMETIEALWDRIIPGAPIVLDDYAFRGHEDQYEAWNRFAARTAHPIFTLPTGQGLMLRR
ncbi:MAG: TylF/MycF/NovP-related O-methyltransferase, partial [Beijerinckiaceae bacterium]